MFGEPVDVAAVVRAPEWEIWAAWLLGEDPGPAIARLTLGQRPQWAEYIEKWHRRAAKRPAGSMHALGRWHWVSGAPVAGRVEPGSALYVLSRRRLRLRIPLDYRNSDLGSRSFGPSGLVFRRNCYPCCTGPTAVCGCPVAFEAVTLDQDLPSPRGMRRRWWPREIERPCPDWRDAALGLEACGDRQ